MFMKFRQSKTVYDVIQNPQMILLCKKGASITGPMTRGLKFEL